MTFESGSFEIFMEDFKYDMRGANGSTRERRVSEDPKERGFENLSLTCLFVGYLVPLSFSDSNGLRTHRILQQQTLYSTALGFGESIYRPQMKLYYGKEEKRNERETSIVGVEIPKMDPMIPDSNSFRFDILCYLKVNTTLDSIPRLTIYNTKRRADWEYNPIVRKILHDIMESVYYLPPNDSSSPIQAASLLEKLYTFLSTIQIDHNDVELVRQ
ncbi:hypothetical protein FB446DRAFT_705902 [Lentinula raphanica]|nr:hypothetical protein FB446DRAFT_705902 [Lentinula raphanica]